MPHRFSSASFRANLTRTARWPCIVMSRGFPRIATRPTGRELSRTNEGPLIGAAAQRLIAPDLMGVTIRTAGLRPPAAIVEVPICRIADRPFAGAAVQGEGGYEVSVGPFESGQLLSGQRSRNTRFHDRGGESNALPVRTFYGLIFQKLGHEHSPLTLQGLRRTLQRSAA